MVLERATCKPRCVRCVNVRPYHSATDPVTSYTNSLKSFTPYHTLTAITSTTIAKAHLEKAKRYPDTAQRENAQNAALDNLDSMNVIQWIPDVELLNKSKLIPLNMGYSYKTETKGTIALRKALYAARGDKNDNTSTLRPIQNNHVHGRLNNSTNLFSA